MRQLQLPRALSAGEQVELAGDEYHYLARVLRRRPGDQLTVLDAAGRHWRLLVQTDDGSKLTARVDPIPDGAGVALPGSALPGAEAMPAIALYQAIPKGRKLDESIRQLVQAGVDRVHPITTERTVVRPDGGGNRIDRWQRIAREAVQQSGAPRPVEIAEPVALDHVHPRPGALALVLHTQPLAQTTLHRYLAETPSAVDLVVGPEGGFTDVEVELLRDRGFQPLWLGPRILRAESAVLFAIAALGILILERASWQPVE
ncbi:MAG: RsmE family RNA methyltransferase [Spirochaetota bacterium]